MLRNKVSMRLKSAYKVFLFINTNNKKERKKSENNTLGLRAKRPNGKS